MSTSFLEILISRHSLELYWKQFWNFFNLKHFCRKFCLTERLVEVTNVKVVQSKTGEKKQDEKFTSFPLMARSVTLVQILLFNHLFYTIGRFEVLWTSLTHSLKISEPVCFFNGFFPRCYVQNNSFHGSYHYFKFANYRCWSSLGTSRRAHQNPSTDKFVVITDF